MIRILKQASWSPYLVGALIGVLSWATFYFMEKALGTSTSIVQVAGALEGVVSESHVRESSYLSKYVVGTPVFDWQMALVISMALGSYFSARLSRTLIQERVPKLWADRFGKSVGKRYGAAFLGGGLLIFGARLAGGCTSGHGISGGLQLAVSSWIFLIAMFAAGIAGAFALYGKGQKHV